MKQREELLFYDAYAVENYQLPERKEKGKCLWYFTRLPWRRERMKT